MFGPLIDSAILLFFFASLWYVLALLKKDNSIADIAWGLGYVLVVWFVHLKYGNPFLLCCMVTIWGLRLAVHIGIRNVSTGEDWRYRNWRAEWGRWFYVRSYLQIFILQGFLLWVIALPLMQVEDAWLEFSIFQWLGISVWLVGFFWETIADWQLMRFKKDASNKGKVMMEGLWQFSRHPNYFGEILVWWGIHLFVLPYGSWWLIVSPLTITFLLNRVSGVPMLEKKYGGNEAYQKYIRQTNALLPTFRKFFVKKN